MKWRRLSSLLALAGIALLAACDLPEAQDAQIGCGVDPSSSPSCPNYPGLPEAGDDTGEASVLEAESPDSFAGLDSGAD